MSFRDRSWPITVTVPLAVAALMVLFGVVLSERVLSRLNETQERHLVDLSQSYLDGLSSAIGPSILREDNWEVFDAIARAQELHKSLHPSQTIVTNADGAVIAASDPKTHPIGSIVPRGNITSSPTESESFSFDAGATTASAIRVLSYPGRIAGIIYATFDTRHLAAERRDVVMALVLTNSILTILLAAAGWLLVARMMQPVRILAAHLGVARESMAEPIPESVVSKTKGEFERLFLGYNALVRSIKEKEDLSRRLAEEKRLSSLGRLASALAHEINNPLGGLFNALATLKTHGYLANIREGSLGLLERGLIGIRDVVRTTLTIYRTDVTARHLTAPDIDDLALLIAPEARRKFVEISIQNTLTGPIPLPSTPIRQAVLNLLLNAVDAAPAGSGVELSAAATMRHLEISVTDRGAGIPKIAAEVLTGQPGAPPLLDGGGLGLWTTGRLIADLGGQIEVKHPAVGGTSVKLLIPLLREELSNVA
ncbi:MAG: sensor histidine kinase [Afipia sp.]|uniref:histidine kinase n=1 Tax=Candidatus Afipia apatlaquensis TaxID=2712852 RepID=A0A7C9VDI8_9BRAD|nr:sensor histidine kinase [Afipia sp.]MBQ8102591.1 sensor histidine kinase [Afipia sp.]NGX95147.1 sensor histidine kinase [Candidatus Afipia apatlaquensis]